MCEIVAFKGKGITKHAVEEFADRFSAEHNFPRDMALVMTLACLGKSPVVLVDPETVESVYVDPNEGTPHGDPETALLILYSAEGLLHLGEEIGNNARSHPHPTCLGALVPPTLVRRGIRKVARALLKEMVGIDVLDEDNVVSGDEFRSKLTDNSRACRNKDRLVQDSPGLLFKRGGKGPQITELTPEKLMELLGDIPDTLPPDLINGDDCEDKPDEVDEDNIN